MQHEQRVAAEQARGVDAEREILAHALLGISLDGVERADVIPSALHWRVVPLLAARRKSND